MSFFDELRNRARQDPKLVVLPECDADTEGVIRKAAEIAAAQGTAKPILLTRQMIQESGKVDEFAEAYAARRGKSVALGRRLVQDPIPFGVMMVKQGYAHGMVAGRYAKSGEVMKFANAFIGEEEGRISSGLFFKEAPAGYPVFKLIACADMVVNENPDAEQLYRIILTSAETFRDLTGIEPKIALISYLTGSANQTQINTPETKKIVDALELYKQKNHPWVAFQAQLDAALSPAVARSKGAPFTDGPADLWIGSNLTVANPVYKLLRDLVPGGESMFVIQGLKLPVLDLSRSDSADNVANAIAACTVCARAFEKQGRYGTINTFFVRG